MDIEGILALPESEPIRDRAEYWINFLYHKVEFRMPHSVKHTAAHCARVLIFSLIIGHRKGLTEEEMEILAHASVFHDSRRMNDWYDTGHGARAAKYYREYTRSSELPYYSLASTIMAYHDLDDEDGLAAMDRTDDPERGKLLYRIFKDADALDRFRLGPGGLDVRYLRTEEARNLCDFAKGVWENYCGDERRMPK